MRKWWKRLGLVAGCLAGLETFCEPAWAQSPGGGMSSFGWHAGGGPGKGAPATSPGDAAACNYLLNDGSPGAFSALDNCDPWRRPLFWASAEGFYGITRRAPLGVPLVTSS